MGKQWVLNLLAVVLLAPSVAFGIQERSGVISMKFDLSAHPVNEEAKLWVPYPVSDSYQTITNVNVEGNYTEAAVYTDSANQTPMLYVRWNRGAKERNLIFSFAVDRREVAVRDLPEREAAWDPADYAPFLTATSLGPVDGKIKKLADRITKGQTTVLGKARAVYNWICENMSRDPESHGCGSGDVCMLLESPKGKCADIHSVFVTLARAAGVPSREIFGLRQGKSAEQDLSTWQHCWAEFYLPGYGWVPVDPGDVLKMMLQEKLAFSDARAAEYRNYFWGGIDPYRVQLSKGRDLVLNPPQEGQPVNYLMYPFAQVGGQTLDWLDPAEFKYSITYRVN
jgi:transglutaminase-like putative cysteine protease